MENWNSKFLKLKSLIPESFYQDSKHKEYKKTEISVSKSPKFLNKISKNSLLKRPKTSKSPTKDVVATDLSGNDDKQEFQEKENALESVQKSQKEKALNLNFNIHNDNAQVTKGKKRDAQGQLATILKKKQKIKELEKVDPSKSLELTQEHEWKKAEALANGKKVKDDPTLLRKSIQRTKTIKKKSEKEWKNRIKNTALSIKERQKKRLENIQNKKARNAKGKGKKGKKARPGFEGKKGKTARPGSEGKKPKK